MTKRSTLSEDELYGALIESVGAETAERVREFVETISEVGIVPEFKSAAVMLKVPDPAGEALGASLPCHRKIGPSLQS